jgi:hypothetical protein
MTSTIAKPDFSLGFTHPRMGVSTASWAPPVLDFRPVKLDVGPPTTPAGATMRGRRGEAVHVPGLTDKSSREIRTDMLRSGYVGGSEADRKFTNMHPVEVHDYSGMPKDQADAVFRGTNVRHSKFQTQSDAAYDGNLSLVSEVVDTVHDGGYGNLSELVAEVVDTVRNGGYSGERLLSENRDYDEMFNEMADYILEMTEQFSVTPEDVLWAFHICAEQGNILPSEFLERMDSMTRGERLAYVKEVLAQFTEAVRTAKASQGLHDVDKPTKPKTTNGITGSSPSERSAAHAIAVASANRKPRKNNVASSGIVGESVVQVSPRLARLPGF